MKLTEACWLMAAGMTVLSLGMVGCQITVPEIVIRNGTDGTNWTVTTTGTTTTTQPPAKPDEDVSPVVISGTATSDFDWKDAEGDNSVYCDGVEFRCLVNDNMMERDAWITRLSVKCGGMKLVKISDGSVKAIGQDFKSDNNTFRWMGWKIRTDQSTMVTNNVILLKGEQRGGTTRGYWRTIK